MESSSKNSNNRKRAKPRKVNPEAFMWEKCKKGCTLLLKSEFIEVSGRLTWESPYAIGFIPKTRTRYAGLRDGEEVLILKSSLVLIRPHPQEKKDNAGGKSI